MNRHSGLDPESHNMKEEITYEPSLRGFKNPKQSVQKERITSLLSRLVMTNEPLLRTFGCRSRQAKVKQSVLEEKE